MNGVQIFPLQMTLTLIVYALIAKWYVAPRLSLLPFHDALALLMSPHALRHLGLTALVPVVVDPNVPREWSIPVGYGDLVAQVLALLSLLALRARWSIALALVWLCNIEGLLDFLAAAVQSTRVGVTRYHLDGFWFLPTFFVPALLVSHVMIFRLLLKRSP